MNKLLKRGYIYLIGSLMSLVGIANAGNVTIQGENNLDDKGSKQTINGEYNAGDGIIKENVKNELKNNEGKLNCEIYKNLYKLIGSNSNYTIAQCFDEDGAIFVQENRFTLDVRNGSYTTIIYYLVYLKNGIIHKQTLNVSSYSG